MTRVIRRVLSTTSANEAVGTATSWIPLNPLADDFEVGGGIRVSGTVRWGIQHTFDNPFDSSITPLAHDHSTVSGAQANTDFNYIVPIAAVRMVLTSAAASGRTSATLSLIQGGY